MLSLWLLLVALGASNAHAAACCGGSLLLPSLITTDDEAQLSAQLSTSSVVGDAPAGGLPVFRSPGDDESTQTLKLDGAYLLADRWQFGGSLPISRRSRARDGAGSHEAYGVGDAALSLGYEALPEYSYSVWRPRGFAYLQVRLPTGRSAFDSRVPWGVDALGRGNSAVSLGSLWLKSWGGWDVSGLFELHRGLNRLWMQDKDTPVRYQGAWGASAGLSGGYSPGAGSWRLGASFQPAYETPVRTTVAGVTSVAPVEAVWNAGAQLSYRPNMQWAATLSYLDQTLFGPVSNTTLSRAVSLQLQRRWER